MERLPMKFQQTVRSVHGANGARWLDGFDSLIQHCEQRWNLTIREAYPLSYNYVAPADGADGREYVLKLRVPEDPESMREFDALRLYEGRGAVRLADAEPERGILLLERCSPGRTLLSVEDDAEATRIAGALIRKLRTPAPAGSRFPTTRDWALGLQKLRARFDGGTGPLPERLVGAAESGYEQLHATISSPLQLLHGDLHHENILSAEREPWLAIDPKGVIGEPAFEPVQYLINRLPDEPEAATRLIAERARLFARELELDAQRILAWTFCHSVLSAWWCIEDGVSDAESSIRIAEGLETLLTRH
ncbi:aminoglycoside phosphotransferase family protein [Cohnella lubricantis]|uniref:Phosphotransferase n=1 Tax=Cohnella lubricantis TaxID=2163172 RepID=A0A841T8X6_9BACL|nr:aminoglycoside phosphotransferase family protein [Cohnella lubricantis]MBB6676529.1 phosphotransferase [Cohnella lubricantis]MBP2120521.1 streptomycin 6-kinase [Cohnella lubricantis]